MSEQRAGPGRSASVDWWPAFVLAVTALVVMGSLLVHSPLTQVLIRRGTAE